MTAAQQLELMEALWKNMTERKTNREPPDWHQEYLTARENAVAAGEDVFITLDELENELKHELE